MHIAAHDFCEGLQIFLPVHVQRTVKVQKELLALVYTEYVRVPAHIAKANGLDTLKYLNYVFRHMLMADGNLTEDFLETLMPWNVNVQAECKRGYI